MQLASISLDKLPEETLWEGITEAIKTLTESDKEEGGSRETWRLHIGHNRGSLVMEEFDGVLSQIMLESSLSVQNPNSLESHKQMREKTTFILFFSLESKLLESVDFTRQIWPVCFDNGIRRGPERRSMHFHLSIHQRFSSEGKPLEIDPITGNEGQVELYIEGKIFEWQNGGDAINSSLFYEIKDGHLRPLSHAISDFTRDRVRLVQEIMEVKTAPDTQTQDNIPEVVSQEMTTETTSLIQQPSQPEKPEYTVRVFSEALEVFVGGMRIGEVQIIPDINTPEIIKEYLDSFRKSQELSEVSDD